MRHTVVTHPILSQILICVLPVIISHKGHQVMNTTMRRVQMWFHSMFVHVFYYQVHPPLCTPALGYVHIPTTPIYTARSSRVDST